MVWLDANLEQLIGEAAALELAGETFVIPAEVKATARLAQEAARDQSPVEIYLRAWFANQPPDVYITNDVLHTAISTVKAGRLQGIGAKTLRELGFREFDQRVKESGCAGRAGRTSRGMG